MVDINNKMISGMISRLNPAETQKVLKHIEKLLKENLISVEAIWENQKQLVPAIISQWDRNEYIELKIDYLTRLVQKMMRDQKLSYDDFTMLPPKPHIEMVIEK